MDVFFTQEEFTIPELEEIKWESMESGGLENAIYALYIQHEIDLSLKQSAFQMFQNLQDGNDSEDR